MIEGADASLDPLALIGPMRSLFSTVSEQRARSTFGLLDLDDGDVHVKAGHLDGAPVFVVKVASWIPGLTRTGRPPGGGGIAVFSASSGAPLAMIVDEHRLTDARTAAAGALATDLLADSSAEHVAVLGSGTQATLQVLTLHAIRPLRGITVWARRRERAERVAQELQDCTGSPAGVAGSVREAVSAAPIVITATAATSALIDGDWLEPGQHLTALGADDSRKRELDERCFARAARVVVDSRAQTCRQAELAAALESGCIAEDDVVELGEVLNGSRPGRLEHEEITIAKLTGLAAQDVVTARLVLDQHLKER